MSLRHDGELPPLTPGQQAEAIRLAARLQAEHEARSSNEALLLAAEEAGIERRFLHEAVARVARVEDTRRRVPLPVGPVVALGLLFVAVALVVVLALKAIPIFTLGVVLLLVSFLFALPPTSLGRSRDRTTLQVFLAWVAADLVFMVYLLTQGAWGNFEWANFFGMLAVVLTTQAFGTVVGVDLAQRAYRLSARLARRRPQSL